MRHDMRHCEDKYRNCEHETDPEPSRHLAQFGVFFFPAGNRRFQLKRHPADRAISGMILLNLRMHRAGVDHCRSLSLQGAKVPRQQSSVETTSMLFNRFSIVGELSSAARIHLSAATSFLATDAKFSFFMVLCLWLRGEL